ncbi:MAG TPA: SDR family NAD(P)-dependent oxidoreductase [Anaerolineales bacterium]|nr:SDR family NAD(P)-dependent oxidoreductase [Anaerolineales bacterium]
MSTQTSSGSLAEGKSILITGCSSGIGWETAIKLAGQGFTVFATVRKESDAAKLGDLGISDLVPVCPVDLTNLEHIANAERLIANELAHRGEKGLYGLINNAGGGSPAPIELLELDKFHQELQARVLGSVAMVQTFLPLLRQAHGRIVWIMTPALMPTPYVTSIHACDFAINCIARTLEIELKPWNIPNIMIRCGGIETPAGLRTTSDVEMIFGRGLRQRVLLYEKALRKWKRDMNAFDAKRTDPEKVAEVVLRALIARSPKRRYAVGYMAGAASFLELMPQTVSDWILKQRF